MRNALITKTKVRVHPLFLALSAFMLLFGLAQAVGAAFFAVLIHESAHAAAARSRGYRLNELVLLPYGAVLFGDERMDSKSGAIIALAGPLASLLAAALTASLWWLLPPLHSFTEAFFHANVGLAVFNILPAFPLDGGRLLLSVAKNKPRALKRLRICGVVVSVVLFALFITSAFFKLSLMLGVFAVFTFYGATFGTRNEMYVHVADVRRKSYGTGVEKKTVMMGGDVPLVRVLHLMRQDVLLEVAVLGEDGRVVGVLNEERLRKALTERSFSDTLKELV